MNLQILFLLSLDFNNLRESKRHAPDHSSSQADPDKGYLVEGFNW